MMQSFLQRAILRVALTTGRTIPGASVCLKWAPTLSPLPAGGKTIKTEQSGAEEGAENTGQRLKRSGGHSDCTGGGRERFRSRINGLQDDEANESHSSGSQVDTGP
jgi:hypothetical protein